MPIQTITLQPGTDAIVQAYSTIWLQVTAQNASGAAVPDLVECDVYIDGVLYRTYARTVPHSATNTNSTWRFDIKGAVQTYLGDKTVTFSNGYTISGDHAYCFVYCVFRAWTKDSQGLLMPESGADMPSENFAVVNASVGATNFLNDLNVHKFGEWQANVYPLTHRPNGYQLCADDNDIFPVILPVAINKLRLFYSTKSNPAPQLSTVITSFFSGLVTYLPTGPAQLRNLFSVLNGATDPPDFDQVTEYIVQGVSGSDAIILTTPLFKIAGCCNSDDKVRIVFRQTCGTFDAINLDLVRVPVAIKSSAYQRYSDDVHEHTVTRFDVDIDTIQLCRAKGYKESDQLWVEELFASSLAWVDKGTEGLIPINILDGSFDLIKEEERYSYHVELQFRYSQKKQEIQS